MTLRLDRVLIVTLIAAGIMLSLWGAGFMLFRQNFTAYTTPKEMVQADAIVVLTGGTGRITSGFDLLEKEAAERLFISGVYQGVDVRQLLDLSQKQESRLDCCITLGYEAENTVENAIETASWMKDNNYTSLWLVTANYHMPRAAMEFQRLAPNVTVFQYPVEADQEKSAYRALMLQFREYNKFILAWLRNLLLSLYPA